MILPPIKISNILKKYGIRPTKGLGQNFLVDESALRKIVEYAEVNQHDQVLEIGPGLGSLTRHLAVAAKNVIAVEIDSKLLSPLKDVLSEFNNVKIIHADILNVNIGEILGEYQYLVVANIPYYITSALLRHLLESSAKPARIILTVQKEVAQRICEKPGNLSLLALSVQVFGKPSVVATIPAGAFFPAPKVDSAIVRIDLYDEPRVNRDKLDVFFKLIKAGFSQKRKMLRNTLSTGMGWEKELVETKLAEVDIDTSRRAQTLTVDEWCKIVQNEGEDN